MSEVSSMRWYVVQTQVNNEAKAALNLRRQGFDIYFPRCLKRRRHARKIDLIAKPLFPRYLFVAIDLTTQRWRSIQSTFGVTRLVSHGDEPSPVPEGVVSAIKAREDERGLVRLQLRPNFRAGEKVRVLDGVFADCLGFYDGMRDADRVAILLDLLGRKVRVTVDVDVVAAA